MQHPQQQAFTIVGPTDQVVGLTTLIEAASTPGALALPAVIDVVRTLIEAYGAFIVSDAILAEHGVTSSRSDKTQAMALLGVPHTCPPSRRNGTWCPTSVSELQGEHLLTLSTLLPNIGFGVGYVRPVPENGPTAFTPLLRHDAILIEKGAWCVRPRQP